MQLVLYHEDNRILYKASIRSPVVTANGVEFDEGSVIADLFLLLEDTVEVGEEVTDELRSLDQKEKYRKAPEIDLQKENEDLKARLESAEAAIIGLMDFM